MTELTIGDTSRDGAFVITDTRWDFNGTMFVTVRDTMGTGCRIGGMDIPAMRRLARRAIAKPELTRSSRLVRTFVGGRCDNATFAVSRL